MPRDRWEDDEDRPRRRRRPIRYDDDVADRAPSTPGSITALAVVNFVLASLVGIATLCCSPIMIFAGDLVVPLGQLGFPTGRAGMILMVAGFAGLLLWVIGTIVSGIGIISMRHWGKVLQLILAGYASLLGTLGLVFSTLIFVNAPPGQPETFMPMFIGFLVPGIIFMGHALWSFVLLLRPKYTHEFH